MLIGECKNVEMLPPLLLTLKLGINGSELPRDCAGHGFEFVVSTVVWLAIALISGATTVVDAGERLPPVVSGAWFPDFAWEASFRICRRSVMLIVTVSAVVGNVVSMGAVSSAT